MILHNNFPDLVFFPYVHIAFSSGSIHAAEEQVILNKMVKHFPKESDLKAKFNGGTAQYRSQDPATLLEVIGESFKFFFDKVTSSQKI
jgi:hypothetical protein